tara:strand:- start:87 stop:350 length:264 start_codon:yes stop_codon:yes gene_type:complete
MELTLLQVLLAAFVTIIVSSGASFIALLKTSSIVTTKMEMMITELNHLRDRLERYSNRIRDLERQVARLSGQIDASHIMAESESTKE